MRIGLVATRYAEALYGLAREKGALAAVQADVDVLAGVLASPAGRSLFDARVPELETRKRVDVLAAKMHALTNNFLHLLLDKRRFAVVAELPAAFRRCALQDRGQVEGVVESPRPLGQGELAEIAVAVKSVIGKEVLLESRTNTDLIAGVRVYVDNRLIDQSALGRLEGLRSKLLKARVS